MDAEDVEKLYVQNTYRRLASHPFSSLKSASKESVSSRQWPRVRDFIANDVDPYGLLVDVGCGHNRHQLRNGFTIAVDSCEEALLQNEMNSYWMNDRVLADAMHMPFRDDFADGVLCVSVLHHFASIERRLKILQGLSHVMEKSADSRAMICVWAMEQPNGQFVANDVLVPLNVHELSIGGARPPIRFHMDSTREQRIIRNSLPVKILSHYDGKNTITKLHQHMSAGAYRVLREVTDWLHSRMINPAYDKIQVVESELGILQRAKCLWAIGRRAVGLENNGQDVLEALADDISRQIIKQAFGDALRGMKKEVYRYYHLFEGGELEELVDSVGALTVVRSSYDQANWWIIVGKSLDP